MSEKTARKPIAQVVGLNIAPARTRRHLDRNGINRDVEARIAEVKARLHAIKKTGGPVLPTAPSNLNSARNASDKDKEAHKNARSAYEADLKKYNDYVSDRYVNLKRVYETCKVLQKLLALHSKKEKSEGHAKEVAELVHTLTDKSSTPKHLESDSNNRRATKAAKSGFHVHVEGADLQNADAVRSRLEALRNSDKDLEHFFERDRVAKERVRFNDPAAVALATALEFVVEEVVEFGIKNTRDQKKKIVQPDYCVYPGMDKLHFSAFVRNLPPVTSLLERQERKKQYELDMANAKHTAYLAAKLKAKKHKTKREKVNFEYPSFPQKEVDNGYATVTELKGEDGKTKLYYQWYGIDITKDGSDENDTNFYHYVNQVCKQVVDRHEDIGDTDVRDLRFSSNLRKFLVDLIISFTSRVSPQIRILISAMDIKTVNHDVVKTVLKQFLAYGYYSATGVVKFEAEHQRLFDMIDEKVRLCQVHQTGMVTKPSATASSDDSGSDSEREPTGYTEDPTPTNTVATPATNGHANGHANGDDLNDDSSDEEEDEPKSAPAATASATPGKALKPALPKAAAKPAPKVATART